MPTPSKEAAIQVVPRPWRRPTGCSDDKPRVLQTLEEAGWNTTVVREVVPEEVMALKGEPGGHLVLGGADLAASFRRHDLIDEYRIYVHPVVIGRKLQAPLGRRREMTDLVPVPG